MRVEHTLDTKKQLALSLKRQMAQKPFNKITIKDIVEDCGLNRQTFYYHFSDIYACMEWMYHEETLALIEQYKDINDWRGCVTDILYYVKENADVCKCALHSMGHEQLRNFFYQDFILIYKVVFDLLSVDLDVDEDFKTFVADLYLYGAEGFILHWLDSGMKETPEQLVDWLSYFLEGNIRAVFLNYVQRREAKKLRNVKPDD